MKGPNEIYDDNGMPHWKTKEYISKLGKLCVNYNRGFRYVVWHSFDKKGYPLQEIFSKKKHLEEFLDKVNAKLVDEYYD